MGLGNIGAEKMKEILTGQKTLRTQKQVTVDGVTITEEQFNTVEYFDRLRGPAAWIEFVAWAAEHEKETREQIVRNHASEILTALEAMVQPHSETTGAARVAAISMLERLRLR